MDAKKQRLSSGKKVQVMLLIVYTVAIIYFMFFGFDRPQIGSALREYRFSIVPARIPLWFPKDSSLIFSRRWLFSLGNLLAFVPFGVFVPMIFGARYHRFLSIFLLSILSLELLQMVTYLGSFDVEDVIVNALGATIGFCAYRLGGKFKLRSQKIIGVFCLILIFSFFMIAFAEKFNKIFAG